MDDISSVQKREYKSFNAKIMKEIDVLNSMPKEIRENRSLRNLLLYYYFNSKNENPFRMDIEKTVPQIITMDWDRIEEDVKKRRFQREYNPYFNIRKTILNSN